MTDNESLEKRLASIIDPWIVNGGDVCNSDSILALILLHPEVADELMGCLEVLAQLRRSVSERSLTDERQSVELKRLTFDAIEIPGFDIRGILGRGGMGVVYDAVQHGTNRSVALKVLPVGSVNPVSVERFLREAVTAATLAHPHIVPIHAVGQHNGLHWYAMQKIDGMSVSQWLASCEGPAPLNRVLAIGIAAADALAAAHAKGIVHRDIKPGNLLVDENDHVWLADFGLARREVDVIATATGAIMGTPRYMSPEQVAGVDASVDHRTDIYSLGASLFELATGKPVFEETTPLKLLRQIRDDPPPHPRDVNPAVPRDLSVVLLKTLDKEPSFRYSSASELGDDLRAISRGGKINATGLPLPVRVSRFIGQHWRVLEIGSITAIATCLAIAIAWLGVFEWQEQTRGDLIIQVAGGPYQTTLKRVGTPAAAESPQIDSTSRRLTKLIRVTTPMQQPMSLMAGQYEIAFAGENQFEQTTQSTVVAGRLNEQRYLDRRGASAIVLMNSSICIPNADRWIGLLSDRSLRVYGQSEQPATEVMLDVVAGIDSERFGYRRSDYYQGDWSVAEPVHQRPPRWLPFPDVDVTKSDGLVMIAASTPPQIATFNSDGELIWTHIYENALPPQSGTIGLDQSDRSLPSVMDVQVIDDLDSDDVCDVLLSGSVVDDSGGVTRGLITVSGKMGIVIATCVLPPSPRESNNPVPVWMERGLLLHDAMDPNESNRLPIFQRRSHGLPGYGLQHFSNRSYSIGNPPRTGDAFNTLTAPLVFRVDEAWVAVCLVDRQIYRVELSSGRLIGAPFDLGFNPTVPLRKTHNENGQSRIFVAGTVNSRNFRGVKPAGRVAVFDETLNLIHRTEGSFDWPADDGSRVGISYPLFGTFANGQKGYVTPITTDDFSDIGSLQAFTLDTGEPIWKTKTKIPSASPIADRCFQTVDLDNDGVGELIAVSLAACPNAEESRLTISLYVDVLSGQTGSKFTFYSREIGEFPFNSGARIENCQIASSGTSLEATVSIGQDGVDLKNHVVHFDMRSCEFTIAHGLTMVVSPESSPHWYRAKPQAFDLIPDRLLRTAPTEILTQNLSANGLRSHYRDSEGELQLILNDVSGAISRVQASTGQPAWQRLLPRGLLRLADSTFAITRGGSRSAVVYDALRDEQNRIKLDIIDANSGRLLASHESHDRQVPFEILAAPNEDSPIAIFACRRAERFYSSMTGTRPHTPEFTLTAWDTRSLKKIWEIPWQASVDPTPALTWPSSQAVRYQSATGESRILVGERRPNERMLQSRDMFAGELKWERAFTESAISFGAVSAPIACVVQNEKSARVVALDFNPIQGEWNVLLLDGQTGNELASYPVKLYGSGITRGRGLVAFGRTSLTVVDQSEDAATVALVCDRKGTDGQLIFAVELLRVSKNKVSRLNLNGYESANTEASDHDLPWVTSLYVVRQSNGQFARVGVAENRIFAHDLTSGKLLWQFDVPSEFRLQAPEQEFRGLPAVELRSTRGEIRIVSLTDGSLVSKRDYVVNDFVLSAPALDRDEVTILAEQRDCVLAIAPDGRDRRTRSASKLAGSDALGRLTEPSSTSEHIEDPRLTREIFRISSANAILSGLWTICLASLALLLPTCFIVRPLLRRRWSLLTMLMAAPIAIVTSFMWMTLTARTGTPQETLQFSLFGGIPVLASIGLLGYVIAKSRLWTRGTIAILIVIWTPIAVAGLKFLAIRETPDYTIIITPWHYLGTALYVGVVLTIPLAIPLLVLPWFKNRTKVMP